VKISIVTISYNQAEFLEEAILSVLNQDYPDIEYIVVDPGSTDGSREIIEKYRDQITHVVLDPDIGPADGLNRGFSMATGDIYGFLNSDDIFLEGALSTAARTFAEYRDVDVVSAHGFIIDREGKRNRKVFSDPYSLLSDAYGQTVLIQPSTFFKASAYKKVTGFNVENRSNWDGELFYNIAQAGGKFTRVNEFWSGYRLYPESITGGATLDEKIKDYGERKFQEIMGRQKRWYDKPLLLLLKAIKHISNPYALVERLAKGKIYGQG
jgi:glycosyltransferase involved in cell wall biosynthesis